MMIFSANPTPICNLGYVKGDLKKGSQDVANGNQAIAATHDTAGGNVLPDSPSQSAAPTTS